ncbi:MAG: hypothetical protein WC474_02660 [Hydrogenophilaceae bacterium]
MANMRFNQPTCLSFCHPPIDPGTLNRTASDAPGPIGQTLGNLFSALGDGAGWVLDTVALYQMLQNEGLGFLADVYFGKKGGGALPIAEALDQRVKNMSSAHYAFSSEHRFGAMLPFDALAKWFASNDPMKRVLLEHYIEGQGKDYELTLEEMKRMPTYIDLFETTAYSPGLRTAIDEASTGRSVPIDQRVSGQNDALGNYGVYLLGELKPVKGSPSGSATNPYANKLAPAATRVPLVFEGEMNWTDYWDFDSKVALRFKGKTGRPATAEAAVIAVAALVDGVPFNVTSVKVPMTQYSGRFPDY